jgi:hypothetical protein
MTAKESKWTPNDSQRKWVGGERMGGEVMRSEEKNLLSSLPDNILEYLWSQAICRWFLLAICRRAQAHISPLLSADQSLLIISMKWDEFHLTWLTVHAVLWNNIIMKYSMSKISFWGYCKFSFGMTVALYIMHPQYWWIILPYKRRQFICVRRLRRSLWVLDCTRAVVVVFVGDPHRSIGDFCKA